MKLLVILIGFSGWMTLARAEVTTVPFVDLNRYIGKWYELASIPQRFQKQCIANTTAEYSFSENNRIRVLNSCDTKSGKRSVAEGRAEVFDRNSNSKLKVTFLKLFDWVFSVSGNYWIIDLAPDYSLALIGDPTTKYAWLLSRTPAVPVEVLLSAEESFRRQGYDTCKIITSVQTGGLSSRTPLCKIGSLE